MNEPRPSLPLFPHLEDYGAPLTLPPDRRRCSRLIGCPHPDAAAVFCADDSRWRAACTRCGEVLAVADGPRALVAGLEAGNHANVAALVAEDLVVTGHLTGKEWT